jgi:hypothetical protein
MTIAGSVDEISRRRIIGWTFDSDAPQSNLTITIHIDDREFGRCIANLFREGLKEELGDCATGRYGFEFSFDPPLSVFKDYSVRVSVAGEPLPGGVKTLRRPATNSAPLLPIIITSAGRAGTTLLMSEFAQRPEIVVSGEYPFEIKLLAYYSLAFRTLVSVEDRVNSTDPLTMFASENRFKIGHNPYNFPELYGTSGLRRVYEEYYEKIVPDRFAHLFEQLITDYYRLTSQEQDKSFARFFAEKGELDETARLGARQFFGRVYEFVVVRDPRDTLCSAMKFWKLRPAEALEMLKTTLPQLVTIHCESTADTLFLRYEDLVRERAAVRETIYQFLDLDDDSSSPVETDPILFQRHATSADPAVSIGRWRQELEGDLAAECEMAFGAYMERFGYERQPDNSRPGSNLLASRTQTDVVRVLTGHDAVRYFAAPSHPGSAAVDFKITFGSTGNSGPFLREGWAPAESGYTWTAGAEAGLRFPRPAIPGDYLLRLLVRVFVWQDTLPKQRLTISVNGNALASVAVASEIAVVEYDLPWAVFEQHENVELHLLLPDAARPSDVNGAEDDRLLAFCFERLEILPKSERVLLRPTSIRGGSTDTSVNSVVVPNSVPQPELPVGQLMMFFESLGENCEFGLVQRRCAAEPLGLLRFASAPLPKLLAGLRARFEGLSDYDNLDVHLSPNGREYMVLDRRFQLLYHPWVLSGEMTAEQVRDREARRLPLLVRKLLEDLTEASKIFVYHGMEPLSEGEVNDLLDCLQTYGPNTLLWVELADADHPPRSVAWAGKHLLKAYIDRFAPGDNAHDLSLESWIAICSTARDMRMAVQRALSPADVPSG